MENNNQQRSYVLCINDGGYPCSLEVRKVYVMLPDQRAAKHHFVRIIDETGEAYLYPASLFVPIEVPPKATTALFNNPVTPKTLSK